MIITASDRTTELGDTTDNPFVCWRNLAVLGTAASNVGVLTDGALTNALSGTTYDYWLPNVTGTNASFQITFGSATNISFIGVAAHNLSDLGATIIAQYYDGAAWQDAGAGTHTPTDNSAIAFRLNTTESRTIWRINIGNLTAGADVQVGVIFFGNERVFPQRVYDGFAPAIKPTEVQLQSNVSVGGNLLGTSVISQGSKLSTKFSYMSPDFVRTTISDFIRSFNEGEGFFFGWRPTTFDEDVWYCWRDGATISPINEGGLDYMAFSMSARAYTS